ncbi:MAG: ABC transporter permease [Bacteroidia bacterium]|nr:ABC transporter permease [Bacteroidia bacterium]
MGKLEDKLGLHLNEIKKRIKIERTMFVYLALVIIVILFGIIVPASVSKGSIRSVLRESSLLGIVALGQGILMLAGGMDISVGNIMFFTMIYGGNFMRSQPERLIPISILCIGIGALIGFINGFGVAKLKISPIIMTLGTSSIIYGFVYIFGGALMASPAPKNLQYIGKTFVFNTIPLTSFIWLALIVIFLIVLNKSSYGRYIYAVGNNYKATWMSGISSNTVLISAYIICDSLAALAGLLLLGYMGTPTLRFTDIYTMGSIAAVVMGGIEFFSGKGSIIGVIAGVLIVRFLFTVLVMMNVPEAGRMIIEGALIIAIVALYNLKKIE